LGLKYEIDLPLDAPERTVLHGEIIRSKVFTRKLYNQWYAEFVRCLNQCPEGKYVELGSGGGFFKEIFPDVITSDILELESNDMTFSALDMPFEDASLGAILMIDTFHHIPDSEQFLKECVRCLKPGGRLFMIEPANSAFGRFIYQNYHHEPFIPEAKEWSIPSSGPMSGANGALPWIVFQRDLERLKKQFPELELKEFKYRNPLLYLLSGGVSFKQLLPSFTYPLVAWFDGWMPKVFPAFSMFTSIDLVRK
jgi:SAM-dependent methyltransferase